MSLVLGLGLGLSLAAGNSLGPALVLLLGYFARSSLQAKVGRKFLGAENGEIFFLKKESMFVACVCVFVCVCVCVC